LDSANYQPRLIAATSLQLNLRGEAWSFPEVTPKYLTVNSLHSWYKLPSTL